MSDLISRHVAAEARLARILQRSDIPVLAEHIQELMARLAEPEVTLRQITDVLRKDVGLALRVIRTANSYQYNRSGKPIVTLGHAVSLMGIEALRDTAAALLLVQHFKGHSDGVRNLMALSLLSANHARATAVHVSYPRWEEAYLCGMFRNLGEILVACYFPDDYARVLVEMKQQKLADFQAAILVLGCTYEDIGQGAARHWNMPEQVVSTMHGEIITPVLVRSPQDQLRAVVGFSHELTEVAHREDPKVKGPRLNQLLRMFGVPFDMRLEDIRGVAECAVVETKATFDLLRMPLDHLRLERQIAAAIVSLEEQPGASPGPDPIREACQLIENSIGGTTPDVNGVITHALQSIVTGAGYERALFALVSADHKSIDGRLAAGQGGELLIERFRYPMMRRAGPLGAALFGRRTLIVTEGPYLSSDLAADTGAACFGILPIIVDNVVAGCLYFDHRSIAIPVPAARERDLSRLRDSLVRFIAARRRAA